MSAIFELYEKMLDIVPEERMGNCSKSSKFFSIYFPNGRLQFAVLDIEETKYEGLIGVSEYEDKYRPPLTGCVGKEKTFFSVEEAFSYINDKTVRESD